MRYKIAEGRLLRFHGKVFRSGDEDAHTGIGPTSIPKLLKAGIIVEVECDPAEPMTGYLGVRRQGRSWKYRARKKGGVKAKSKAVKQRAMKLKRYGRRRARERFVDWPPEPDWPEHNEDAEDAQDRTSAFLASMRLSEVPVFAVGVNDMWEVMRLMSIELRPAAKEVYRKRLVELATANL